jgi:hypothetical protein
MLNRLFSTFLYSSGIFYFLRKTSPEFERGPKYNNSFFGFQLIFASQTNVSLLQLTNKIVYHKKAPLSRVYLANFSQKTLANFKQKIICWAKPCLPKAHFSSIADDF